MGQLLVISSPPTISAVLIILFVLIRVLRQLQESDIEATVVSRDDRGKSPDAIVDLELDGIKRRFAVELKSRAPYPGELQALEPGRIRNTLIGNPLLIAPHISESLAAALIRSGWSWADHNGNFDIRAPQLRAKRRHPSTPPKAGRRTHSVPQGPGALAIIRFLINQSIPKQPFGHTELARIGRVSQPRASQVLAQLRDAKLISGSGRNWFAERAALLEAFLAQYKGPGGSDSFFYSLDSPMETARVLVQWAHTQELKLAVSADVGPDLMAPWRRPTHVVAYLGQMVPKTKLELVEASSRVDANVILRIPDDSSVFSTHSVVEDLGPMEMEFVDTTQMIWDLMDLGGTDREEAANNMRRWLLSR